MNESVAILTAEERRRLLDLLDNRESPQARPRASKGATSPLMSLLAVCGHDGRTMHRGTVQGRAMLSCPVCHQVISRNQLDEHIAARLLAERGDLDIWEHIETTADNAADLADIEDAIRDTTALMGRDDADVPALIERLAGLKARRAKTRLRGPAHRTWRITGKKVREAWEASENDEDRRQVLVGQIARVVIVRGRVGRYLDISRVRIEWQPIPQGIPLPDGQMIVERERLDGTPAGEGLVGPVVVTLPDGDRLYATQR